MDVYMEAAIEEARTGLLEGGIPIGSVLVRNGEVIGRGHNRRVQDNDPLAHAEIACLRNAGRIIRYHDTVLYSTLMPCYLCAGAAVQFGIKKVVAGESRTFGGAREFMEAHGIEVIDLDLPECREMMKEFIDRAPEIWNEDIGE
ncbi:MAG TPA: nucleoside deaminase [Methanosarcina sp.]|nr:nucleoside deaminase [Methanosarcina sp.]